MAKFMERKSRRVVARVCGEGRNGELFFLMDIEFQLFPGKKVLEIGCPTVLIYSTLLKCTLVVQMVKMVNFMLRIFYTSKKEKKRGEKKNHSRSSPYAEGTSKHFWYHINVSLLIKYLFAQGELGVCIKIFR